MSKSSQNTLFGIKFLIIIFLVIALIQEIRLIYTINKRINDEMEAINNLAFIRARDITTLEMLKSSRTKIYMISSITILFYSIFLFYLLFKNRLSSGIQEKLHIIIRTVLVLFLILSIVKLLVKNPYTFLDIIIYFYILVFLKEIK